MSLINLINVKKHYLNKTFNLEIKSFDKLLIVGKNGSGKSTLIKLITNYIKPSSGKIFRNIKKISYLEEHPMLPQSMNVNYFIKQIEDLKCLRVNTILYNLFNIPLDKKISELSKGNKQKLAILITFITSSDLIILDEPLNGLDDETIKDFINFLSNYQSAIIVVTHYPNLYNKLNSEIINL